jgi:lipopolysaccharide transport system permease protein
MGSYVREVWKCRYFWLSLVKNDLRSRYRGSWLGMGWSLLQPLAMTGIICAVFSSVFKDQPIEKFGPYVLAGLSFWNYVVLSTLGGCQGFKQAEMYIRQHRAPMAIYPLRIVLGNLFHFLLAMILFIGLAGALNGFPNPWALLSLIPTLVLLAILAWSLATLGGLINVHFPDTKHLLEVAFQGLFYLTPVFYDRKILVSKGLSFLIWFNPMVPFLHLVRDPVLEGVIPSFKVCVAAVVSTGFLAGLALYALYRLEKRLIYYL